MLKNVIEPALQQINSGITLLCSAIDILEQHKDKFEFEIEILIDMVNNEHLNSIRYSLKKKLDEETN